VCGCLYNGLRVWNRYREWERQRQTDRQGFSPM